MMMMMYAEGNTEQTLSSNQILISVQELKTCVKNVVQLGACSKVESHVRKLIQIPSNDKDFHQCVKVVPLTLTVVFGGGLADSGRYVRL